MITKYRNRALIQAAIALVLTLLCILLTLKFQHTPRDQRSGWGALVALTYVVAWIMWMVTSFSLARAKGYQRDFAGGLFIGLYIIGFCFPVAPLFFPVFIMFALEDKAKKRRR